MAEEVFAPHKYGRGLSWQEGDYTRRNISQASGAPGCWMEGGGRADGLVVFSENGIKEVCGRPIFTAPSLELCKKIIINKKSGKPEKKK